MIRAPGEGVVFQGHLVDDTGSRTPEPHSVSGSSRAQEVVYLLVFLQRLPQVGHTLHPRLYKVIAVNGSRDRCPGAARLHELEHGGLSQDVLKDHPVGQQQEVTAAGFHLRAGWVFQVGKEDLVCQTQGAAQSPAYYFELTGHSPVGVRDKLGRGLDCNHGWGLLAVIVRRKGPGCLERSRTFCKESSFSLATRSPCRRGQDRHSLVRWHADPLGSNEPFVFRHARRRWGDLIPNPPRRVWLHYRDRPKNE